MAKPIGEFLVQTLVAAEKFKEPSGIAESP
jgi:hypothetical protein